MKRGLPRAADNVTDLAQIFDHFSAVLNNSTLFIPSTPPVPDIIITTVRQAAPSARRASLVLQPALRQLRSAMRCRLRAAYAGPWQVARLSGQGGCRRTAAAALPAMAHAQAQHNVAAHWTRTRPLLCAAGAARLQRWARARRTESCMCGGVHVMRT